MIHLLLARRGVLVCKRWCCLVVLFLLTDKPLPFRQDCVCVRARIRPFCYRPRLICRHSPLGEWLQRDVLHEKSKVKAVCLTIARMLSPAARVRLDVIMHAVRRLRSNYAQLCLALWALSIIFGLRSHFQPLAAPALATQGPCIMRVYWPWCCIHVKNVIVLQV